MDWPNLIERFIKKGEPPAIANAWDTEEPETYLERLYKESGEPAEFRRILMDTLDTALQERNRLVLNRGLRLIALIPHPDFADVLQQIFFTLRNTRENELSDVALLSLRAIQAIQRNLAQGDPLRAVWQAMWVALLGNSKVGSGDPKYGLAAYQGLRQLGLSLALHYLPLLLRRIDLSEDDLKIILRGLRRDSNKEQIDFAPHLSEAIINLTEEERANHLRTLREALGSELVEKAIDLSRKETQVRLEQNSDLMSRTANSDLPHFADRSPLRYLHDQLFKELAVWLKDVIPVRGTSIWLVDDAEQVVYFRGQAGCPGTEPYPPRILKFGEFASGRVALSRRSELIDLNNPDSPDVYMKQQFIDEGMTALLSVYAYVNKSNELPLAIVVNYFDDSYEKLAHLNDQCEQNARIVVNVCQRVFSKYKNAWVAYLADRLAEKPMLDEAASELVTDISKAIPLCDRIVIYLFHREFRQLFLEKVLVPDTSNYQIATVNPREFGVKLEEPLTKAIARSSEPTRIRDLRKWALDHSSAKVHERLAQLGLDELPSDRIINYLAVSLREPAPVGFTGMLGGFIEVYRSVDKDSAKCFTPVGEHIVKELSSSAAPFIIRAFNFERRFNQPSPNLALQRSESTLGSNSLTTELHNAESSLRSDFYGLLKEWAVSRDSKRSFFAFRTLRDRCKAFWPEDNQFRFGDEEKAARLELQQSILRHEDLFFTDAAVCAINSDLLNKLEVDNPHKERLLELGLVLMPLIDRNQLSGILGLEFGSAFEASLVAREMNEARQDDALKEALKYVRTSVMQTWTDHRRHVRALLAAAFEDLSIRAAKLGKLPKAQNLFNFVAVGGKRDLPPNERSYSDLTATALRRVPSDATCQLAEECNSWQNFASNLGGNLEVDIRNVELMAIPSAIRMILATSTAPVLWGKRASIFLGQEREGWHNVRIVSHKNGEEELRKQGMSLTKGISEYRGWDCVYENDETLYIALPAR